MSRKRRMPAGYVCGVKKRLPKDHVLLRHNPYLGKPIDMIQLARDDERRRLHRDEWDDPDEYYEFCYDVGLRIAAALRGIVIMEKRRRKERCRARRNRKYVPKFEYRNSYPLYEIWDLFYTGEKE